MAARNSRTWECVLCDLNTQEDFLGTSAVCGVRNAGTLIPAARRVVAWAKWNHVPVISSMDSHRHAERTHDGFPVHCVDGTPGQTKLPWTVFGANIRVEGDNTLAVPLDLFKTYQQVIFRKRTHDLFGNPKADRFLTQLRTNEYILFGVGLEFSLNALALGLLARNKNVTVISDCCGFWNSTEADLALRRMQAKGANLVTVEQLLQRRVRNGVRYPVKSNGNGQHVQVWRGLRHAPVGDLDGATPPGANGNGRGNGRHSS